MFQINPCNPNDNKNLRPSHLLYLFNNHKIKYAQCQEKTSLIPYSFPDSITESYDFDLIKSITRI